jgi:protein transport protein SEC23
MLACACVRACNEQAGVHLNPDYAYINDLLQAPEIDAQALMDARFPHPKLTKTEEGGSQARLVMAKLNPSITHSARCVRLPACTGRSSRRPADTAEVAPSSASVVLTDDVSLKVFMEHLRKLAVSNS